MTYHFHPIVGGEAVASPAGLLVVKPFLAPDGPLQGIQDDPLSHPAVAGMVEYADAAQVERALAIGAGAEAIGRQLPLSERRQILVRWMELLIANQAPLVRLLVDEAGKPVDLAGAEFTRSLDTLQATLDALDGTLEALDLGWAPQGKGRTGLIQRVPRGLMTAITPFNFPLNLVLHKLAPAIAAGCPVILKPSPRAPLTAFYVSALALQAGLPPPMLSCILPEDRDLPPLVSDPRVRIVSFTGSAEVGWRIKAQAVRQQVILELGGNAAVIIAPDADLERTIEPVVRGAFAYAGQSCISVQRVFVDAAREETFLQALADAVMHVQCGDPARPGVLCGPMIHPSAASRVEGWLDAFEASDGGVLVRGGREGTVLLPSLVQFHAGSRTPLVSEEVFGPVVACSAYRSLPEAYARVNDSRYGLQAGIFTDHLPTLQAAFRELEVGALLHNDVPTFRADQMPYGGVKDSGWGREGPRYAIQELTEPRMLVLRGP